MDEDGDNKFLGCASSSAMESVRSANIQDPTLSIQRIALQQTLLEHPTLATMWGRPVISWFIIPSNYSYKYHKP